MAIEGREDEVKQDEAPLNVVPNFDSEAGFYWEDLFGWFGSSLVDYTNKVKEHEKEE